MLNTQEYKAQILEELARRFEADKNSLADAYALIWAIDTYASLVWFETGSIGTEPNFKNRIEEQSEAFKVIRSASNAIKHIERDSNSVMVKSIGDIQTGSGPSFHSYYTNLGSSEPTMKITMNWEYDCNTKEYKDGGGKIIGAPKSPLKTQCLIRLYRPAIDAIEAKLTEFR